MGGGLVAVADGEGGTSSHGHGNGHDQHRRTKSTSYKDMDIAKHGARHVVEKERSISHPNERTPKVRSPHCQEHTNTSTLSNDQASLEKDIEQLQICLEQKRSMRMMLERAMGRVSSTISPGHNHVITKIYKKDSTAEKISLARTLKDHLYECPSKLSEELVRCIASIYCWLQNTVSTKSRQKRSPLLARSSTCVIFPRGGVGEDQEWSSKSTVEINWISTNKSQLSGASSAINDYRVLVEQLERVDASHLESNAQMTFWINIYNALIMHAHLAYGIPQGPLRRMALYHKAAYNIGEYAISASAIEQSILCIRTPGRWFENIISTAMRKKSGEGRQQRLARFPLQKFQLLVCFALCTGTFSDPVLRVYTATEVEEQLEASKQEFLQSNDGQ